jgi:hypothetical protein
VTVRSHPYITHDALTELVEVLGVCSVYRWPFRRVSAAVKWLPDAANTSLDAVRPRKSSNLDFCNED